MRNLMYYLHTFILISYSILSIPFVIFVLIWFMKKHYKSLHPGVKLEVIKEKIDETNDELNHLKPHFICAFWLLIILIIIL